MGATRIQLSQCGANIEGLAVSNKSIDLSVSVNVLHFAERNVHFQYAVKDAQPKMIPANHKHMMEST